MSITRSPLSCCLRWLPLLLIGGAAIAQPPVQNPLKINEIYFSGSFAGNVLQANDQFIEVYNGSATMPAFLDGLMIVAFGGQARPNAGALNSQGIAAYKFPGTPGGRQYAVSPGAYIVIARNAQDFTPQNGKNLSGADWECYSGLLDVDNPAQNLVALGAGLFGFHQDFNMGAAADVIALCDGRDTLLTDGIAIPSIIDVVEYNSAGGQKLVPPQLDGGSAGLGVLTGTAIERKTAGEDSNNSTVDFDSAAPSPGYQHGHSNQPLSVLPDIYPLNYLNYKLYDAYDVDTLGARVDQSLHAYSATIGSIAVEIGGRAAGMEIDSTFPPNGRATTAVQYFNNPSGIDLEQYADAQFLTALLGPAATFVSAPEQWLTLFKGSAGFKVAYPILTVDTTILFGTYSINSHADVTGKWDGTETITVPAGTFDCYVFKITVHATAALSIVPVFDNTVVHTFWLARGTGIVRELMPSSNVNIALLGQTFSQAGSERNLRASGMAIMQSAVGAGVRIPSALTLDAPFPNPVSSVCRLVIGAPSAVRGSLRIFDALGREVQTLFSGMLPASEEVVGNIGQLPAGTYTARLESSTGCVTRMFSLIR